MLLDRACAPAAVCLTTAPPPPLQAARASKKGGNCGSVARKATKASGGAASDRERSIKRRQLDERHDANAADLQEYLTALTGTLSTLAGQLEAVQRSAPSIARADLDAALEAAQNALSAERGTALENRVLRLRKLSVNDPSACSEAVGVMLPFISQMEADIQEKSCSIKAAVAALRQ